jgi:hypothetical protein
LVYYWFMRFQLECQANLRQIIGLAKIESQVGIYNLHHCDKISN